MNTMRSFPHARTSWWLFSMVVGSSCATGQTFLDYPAYAVSASGRQGHGFAIRNPDGKPNCVIVTSDHVAKPGDQIRLIGLNSSAQIPMRFELGARYLEGFPQAQLSVLVPDKDLPSCKEFRVGDAQAVGQRDGVVGRTPFVSPTTGVASWARLVYEGPLDACSMQVGAIGSTGVETGFSGGLVSFEDQLLGVVQKASQRVVQVSRFDCAPAFLKRYALAPASAPARPAWDISSLPKEYRDVFDAATKQQVRSDLARRVARESTRLAEEAEMRAKGGVASHGRAADDFGAYMGQLNTQQQIAGYGVRRVLMGNLQGDVLLGWWKFDPAKSLSEVVGPGTWRRERNAYNGNAHALFEGELKGAEMSGAGVLTFQSGEMSYSDWSTAQAPIYSWRSSDGTVFTGAVKDGRWSGPGMLWESDGRLRTVGVWKDGALVEDKTRQFLLP
jgi:hypothetical protein